MRQGDSAEYSRSVCAGRSESDTAEDKARKKHRTKTPVPYARSHPPRQTEEVVARSSREDGGAESAESFRWRSFPKVVSAPTTNHV